MSRSVYIFPLAVLFLWFLCPASTTNAISSGTLGGRPAHPDPAIRNSDVWFIYSLKPGEAKQDDIIVSNMQDHDVSARIYSADSSKSSDGGFALKQFSEEQTQVGSWVRFYPKDPPTHFLPIFKSKNENVIDLCALSQQDLSTIADPKTELPHPVSNESFSELQTWCAGETSFEIKLGAGEKQTFRFIFRVPEGADVGEHTGGILVEKTTPEEQSVSGGSTMRLTTRIGVRLYEIVPGDIEKRLSLEEFRVIKNFKEWGWPWFGSKKQPEEYAIQTALHNHGNVSTEFREKITIEDTLFGRRGEVAEDRIFQSLKQDTFVSNYLWKSPRFGRFSFVQEVHYTDANDNSHTLVSEKVFLWIFPWRELVFACLSILLILLGLLGQHLYHKRKYGGIGWESYIIRSGDTLNALATTVGIPWKILAITNKLRPPYALQEGTVLLVPPKTIGSLKNNISATSPKDIPEITNITPFRQSKPVPFTDTHSPTNSTDTPSLLSEITLYFKIHWITGLLLALILLASFFILLLGLSSRTVLTITRTESSSSELPTPKSNDAEIASKNSSSVQKEDLAISILNGGAKPGSAGRMKSFLEEKGYRHTTAGNVENSTQVKGKTIFFAREAQTEGKTLQELLADYDPNPFSLRDLSEIDTQYPENAHIVIILTEE